MPGTALMHETASNDRAINEPRPLASIVRTYAARYEERSVRRSVTDLLDL